MFTLVSRHLIFPEGWHCLRALKSTKQHRQWDKFVRLLKLNCCSPKSLPPNHAVRSCHTSRRNTLFPPGSGNIHFTKNPASLICLIHFFAKMREHWQLGVMKVKTLEHATGQKWFTSADNNWWTRRQQLKTCFISCMKCMTTGESKWTMCQRFQHNQHKFYSRWEDKQIQWNFFSVSLCWAPTTASNHHFIGHNADYRQTSGNGVTNSFPARQREHERQNRQAGASQELVAWFYVACPFLVAHSELTCQLQWKETGLTVSHDVRRKTVTSLPLYLVQCSAGGRNLIPVPCHIAPILESIRSSRVNRFVMKVQLLFLLKWSPNLTESASICWMFPVLNRTAAFLSGERGRPQRLPICQMFVPSVSATLRHQSDECLDQNMSPRSACSGWDTTVKLMQMSRHTLFYFQTGDNGFVWWEQELQPSVSVLTNVKTSTQFNTALAVSSTEEVAHTQVHSFSCLVSRCDLPLGAKYNKKGTKYSLRVNVCDCRCFVRKQIPL